MTSTTIALNDDQAVTVTPREDGVTLLIEAAGGNAEVRLTWEQADELATALIRDMPVRMPAVGELLGFDRDDGDAPA